MKIYGWAVFVYGLLTLVGGAIGHFKANSLSSLIAGSIFGTLLLLCAFGILKEKTIAVISALALSAILSVFFIYRFALTQNFMPSGMMSILSLLILGMLLFARKKTVRL